MGCSCQFDSWMRQAITTPGNAGLIMLFLVLIFWGIKTQRREHFSSLPLSKAILLNLWSLGLGVAAMLVLVTILLGNLI